MVSKVCQYIVHCIVVVSASLTIALSWSSINTVFY